MSPFEGVMRELDLLNKTLLFKKRGGSPITAEEYAEVKDLVKKIHVESLSIEVLEIGRLLELYDLGLGVRYLEPNFTKLNEAFAWLESQDGESGAESDDF